MLEVNTSKPNETYWRQEGLRKRYYDRDRDRDRDHYHDCDRDRDHYHDCNRERDHYHDCDHDRDPQHDFSCAHEMSSLLHGPKATTKNEEKKMYWVLVNN